MIRYEIPLKTTVESGKPAIAKPYAGRRPHVYFLHPVRFGREVAELCERMDITWENTSYDRAWDVNKWGYGDFYDVRAAIWDFDIVSENMETMLTSDSRFDCMVINCANGFAEFSEKSRAAILERVRAGAGLILLQPFDGKDKAPTAELSELSPLKALYQEGFTKGGYADIAFDKMIHENAWTAEEHPITHGIPFDALPADVLAAYPYEDAGEVILRTQSGHPIGAVKQVGQGRVAAFGYYPRAFLPQHRDFTGTDACFNPIMDDWKGALHGKSFDFLEYYYHMMARAVLWCGGAEPDKAAIESAKVQEGTLSVKVRGEGTRLCAQVKNEYDDVVLPRREIAPETDISSVLLGGGTYRCELSLLQGDAVADFYTTAHALPRQLEITSLACEPAVLQNGDLLRCTGQVKGGKGRKIFLALVDGIGRKLMEQPLVLEEETFSVSFPLQNILSINVFVTLTAYEGSLPILRGRSNQIIVTPEKRYLDDFEVWMNPQNRGQGDMLHYVNRLFPEIGMTGNLIGHNKLVAMSGGEGLGVYWYKRWPYVENKESFLRTQDKKYLVRTPCLNDPAFWEENRKNISTHVSRNKKYGPVAYFAQDEGSLTCYVDALEFCFCDYCMADMRAWLKTVYPSLDALNESWNRKFQSWDEVIPYTTREARKTGDYASWGDHRRFMELSYAKSYENFAKFITDNDPQGRVRMSGCQASTAYSGNDYDLLHQHVRYFEAYPGGNQYEFHRSFKKPDTILGGWFGYGAQGKYVQNRIWYALLHGLTLISIFWEYACLNYDYTFSNSALAMGEAYREIRRSGLGKLLLYACQSDALGIAVHYSMASVHGTEILSRQNDFTENRQGWLDVLEDMGYQYNFISTRRIELGELSKYRVLILPYSIAVGTQEAEAIRVFAESGGLVIGDVQTGLMDEHCKLSEKGMLDDLLGIERLTPDIEPFYVNSGFENADDFPYAFGSLKLGLGEEHDLGTVLSECGTRPLSGKAAFVDGFMRKIPGVVVRDACLGHGVYLNFLLKDYSGQRTRDQGASMRRLLHDVLALSGIKRPVSLKKADGSPMETDVETFYYGYGSGGRVVAIQRSLGDVTETKYDGTVKVDEDKIQVAPEPFTAQLDAVYHVYSVREEKYLGHADHIADEMTAGDCRVYALLPYRATDMELRAEGAILRATLRTEGTLTSPCAFAITVTDPAGVFSTLYSANLLAEGGSLSYTIPFALDDLTGDWRVTVKDVATGVSKTLTVSR